MNEPGDEPNFASVLGLRGHKGNVTGVAVNEQATILATSGFDGTLRLWNLDLGEELSIVTDQPSHGKELISTPIALRIHRRGVPVLSTFALLCGGLTLGGMISRIVLKRSRWDRSSEK